MSSGLQEVCWHIDLKLSTYTYILCVVGFLEGSDVTESDMNNSGSQVCRKSHSDPEGGKSGMAESALDPEK